MQKTVAVLASLKRTKMFNTGKHQHGKSRWPTFGRYRQIYWNDASLV